MELPTFDFTPEDKFEGGGKTVFFGPCPAVMAGLPRDTKKTGLVRMDGKLYRIKGIERWCLGTPYREGESIGLLLEPVD
jgi:hypothetical protein